MQPAVVGYVLATVFVAAGGGCRGGGTEPPPTSPEPAAEPVPVFSDDFDGSELSEHWSTTSDAWRIEDGWVTVAGARNEGLWLDVPLPDAVRITFLARGDSPEGDIKFEVFTDGRTHQTGYIGIFGGWDNRLNIIARLDEHGDDRLVGAHGRQVEPGRTYRMAVERNDARVRWYVDDELFIEFDDPDPLRGSDHAHFGFNDWESPVRFDDVRVYDLGR